ncbi:uncharacterized protein LOC141664542 [Apium graveolens]|uniref:uncharacterized protein LOC141664542 n=1 Tax=Apium graveolens TaxID=4045 RepID=UPI003D78E527
MSSDRRWMNERFDARNNITEEYKLGVQNFIRVALKGDVDSKGRIRCPCKECGNIWYKLPDNVTYDLYRHGIMESYTRWIFHGEKDSSGVEGETCRDDDMYDAHDMLRDFADAHENFGNGEEEPNATAKNFYDMLDGASEPLYPNCSSSTTLSFVNKLLYFKNKHGCSNKGFDELLQLIGSVFPENHNLPETYYDVKKMISGLNMGYEKIDACENDCMLFYKENTDGDEWKAFDARFPRFAKEARNIRLGLSSDGFDPFRDPLARDYTVWPVVMVVYNLPPSMCMKAPYMFMPLIIPGPTDPTKDLHVYLRPLIDELKMLWHTGVETYDRSSRTNFQTRAALIWTISDFPALAMLSGWSTKGKLSCHVCSGDVKGFQLKNGGKTSFFGTARYFLEPGDPLRNSTKFGKREVRSVTARHSGTRAKTTCDLIQFPPPGKLTKRRPRDYGVAHNWTHYSPFFELPYWETLNLRHNIDVMHTEKNVFENIFYTMLNDKNKTKDNLKARHDCEELGIRRELWTPDGKTMPPAPYALVREQVDKLLGWILTLKLLDGYVSNISRCVNLEKHTIQRMKSHDCHIFMQKLLPIVCRDLLPRQVGDAIIELSNFFQDLCSSTLRYSDLLKMEKDVVRIMSKFETIYIPGFFDPMEHLPLHLATECKLGGPVTYRWMYPFERFLHGLKMKVRNKAYPEGSMAERYIEEECVHFCSLYFESEIEAVHNQLRRFEAPKKCIDPNLLSVYTHPTKPIVRKGHRILSVDEDRLIKYYVLINTPEVAKYLSEFHKLVHKQYPEFDDVANERFQKDRFTNWFEKRVADYPKLKQKFKDLIRGPMRDVDIYNGCHCNGYKFGCAKSNERTSPNSGVLVIGTSYKESFQNNYGRLEEILELHYHNGHKVVLFKCHWFDHTTHVKVDRNRMTTVDIRSTLNAEDVFILASQAHQVYYAQSISSAKSPWYTVLTTKSRFVNEEVASKKSSLSNDDALQNDVSNASSSHVEPVVIHDPKNFFIDLRFVENDYSMDDYNEEQDNNKDEYVNVDDEESESDDDMP